ncbi:permease prefix domain 1-containing protein [Nocardioides aquiterrae]|uniref:DUF4153 domain-containing protein n=1 Tax=Nocardioides aquiterrae TaxID=203799 RepID=A0ABP4EZ35_9ACTN
MSELDLEIARWSTHLRRNPALADADVEEMEAHLRDRVADLVDRGLDEDEAFLIAVKRMGNVDAIAQEFAREHAERLWKQLVPPPAAPPGVPGAELAVVLALAAGAALVSRAVAEAFAPERAALCASLLVGPFLGAYFAWKRALSTDVTAVLVAVLVVTGTVVNSYPFDADDATLVLVILHLPVVVWFVVGVAYAGGDWRSHQQRMHLVRFTGEWVVYYTLLALGGGVLVGLTMAAFAAIDVDASRVLVEWVLPLGAAGAVLVAAWLVEAKQAVIENIAPVLTRVFTPLTILMLAAVLVAFAARPGLVAADRDLLILMAAILVLVLGLLLYSVSARDPLEPPRLADTLQLVLVALAIAVDAVVLVAMVARIAEFGPSPNKVAALGLNLVILVNLARSAWLTLGFLRRTRPFADLERWQTTYLPAYPAWAAVVALVLPPVFAFS